MRKQYLLTIVTLLVTILSFSQSLSISEIHYDNCGPYFYCIGSDTDEGVELSGEPNFDLKGWRIELYDGQTGKRYKIEKLSGKLPESGILWVPIQGISDGKDMNYPFTLPPTYTYYAAGIALVNYNVDPAEVAEFLSYQGSFTAKNGPANGMISTDLDVSEDISNPIGNSLQKTDAGWVGPITATPGKANSGQTLSTDEPNKIEGFEMYPNPVTKGELHIISNDFSDKNIEIYSTLGNLVFSRTTHSNEAIDISNINAGLYMVRIEQDGKSITRKLIVK